MLCVKQTERNEMQNKCLFPNTQVNIYIKINAIKCICPKKILQKNRLNMTGYFYYF